ncbi:TIGR00341 family protein [Ponticaulis sp.]|uniref:TIGR00341 family protein n=1 Tax=Ponticaulis sp. TaxID=2020902 RepID=UPI000B67152A|nr:TIGR00341 family protein [Ponticaulis sp.]MAI89194.1 TIGR00341 family protein [Ponticaulis sp.]OUY01188.1 MAG: TIGR00341 family protein [Hyphomonadaceae bacterium TMED5]
MRMMFLSCPVDAEHAVASILKEWDMLDWTVIHAGNDRMDVRVVLPETDSQKLVDALQMRLTTFEGWRLDIVPLEACVGPKTKDTDITPEDDKPRPEQSAETALREEIYEDVAAGAKINSTFLILTVLSAIVAALGMNANSVAVVIGAMVIAPLLGPLLAFAFASAIGDVELMGKSTRTALTGLGIGFGTALLVGFIAPINLESPELLDRTHVGLDSVVLALASGGAAALSVARGLPTTLVGVMVAVALLPPSVAVAVYLGAGEVTLSLRAAVLLATNIISVNIASMLVFALRGIRPRTWLERRSAKRSTQINLAVWGGLLIALIALIILVLS